MKHKTEISAIYIVLFSSDMAEQFVNMQVDKERKHILTKVTRTKRGKKIKESDHNVLTAEFNLEIKESDVQDKLELYNMKTNSAKKNSNSLQQTPR